MKSVIDTLSAGLQPSPQTILFLLHRNIGKEISHRKIVKAVYGDRRPVPRTNIKVWISLLRKHLKDCEAPMIIETVPVGAKWPRHRLCNYRLQRLRSGVLAASIVAMFFSHHAYAQMTPGGVGWPSSTVPSRGFSITTPGEFPTRVTPNGVGGYTVTNPNRPMSFINPDGTGGYTVVTPGGGPLRFIRPND